MLYVGIEVTDLIKTNMVNVMLPVSDGGKLLFYDDGSPYCKEYYFTFYEFNGKVFSNLNSKIYNQLKSMSSLSEKVRGYLDRVELNKDGNPVGIDQYFSLYGLSYNFLNKSFVGLKFFSDCRMTVKEVGEKILFIKSKLGELGISDPEILFFVYI